MATDGDIRSCWLVGVLDEAISLELFFRVLSVFGEGTGTDGCGCLPWSYNLNGVCLDSARGT